MNHKCTKCANFIRRRQPMILHYIGNNFLVYRCQICGNTSEEQKKVPIRRINRTKKDLSHAVR